MGRILAIDYGLKRTGIAVTDPLQIIANGLDTVPTHQLLTWLKTYTQTEPVDCFVVGMPKNLNNEATDSTSHVMGFTRKLKKEFPDKPVHLADERFTSRIAQQTMLHAGLKKKDRQNKAMVDKVSATLILQSYLESRI